MQIPKILQNSAIYTAFLSPSDYGIRSQSDAGMYNLGQQYGSVMTFVANAINQAYVPWFYEKVNEGKQGLKRIVQTADASICLVSVIAIIMSLFAEEIFGIMIKNPAYNGVWRIVPCIVFAYVFQSIYFFFVNVLFLKDTQVVFTITVTSIFANIGLKINLCSLFLSSVFLSCSFRLTISEKSSFMV